MVYCPECGQSNAPHAKFCRHCGASLADVSPPVPVPAGTPTPPREPPVCRSCGYIGTPDEKFCGTCGSTLREETPVVPAVPVPLPPTRTCPACGSVMSIEMKFCGECGASMTERPAPASVTPPVFSPPASFVTQVQAEAVRSCRFCGNPVKPGEKFCSTCGTIVKDEPAPAAVPVAVSTPPPVSVPLPVAEPVCATCGSPVADTEKFCGFCGTPVVRAMGAEEVIGVIGNAKKMKMFGVSYDTYTLVITSRRMIFAQLTQALANVAIMEAQVKAKAEGKVFLGIVQDQMAASFGFAMRYEKMTPDQALLETPGNIAIQNSHISAIKMQLKDSGNTIYHEFKTVIESKDGKYEFIIAEDERFTNLLKTVYGDRLHMPPGYFSKAGVRIKFF